MAVLDFLIIQKILYSSRTPNFRVKNERMSPNCSLYIFIRNYIYQIINSTQKSESSLQKQYKM